MDNHLDPRSDAALERPSLAPWRSIVLKLTLFVGVLVALTAGTLITVGFYYTSFMLRDQIDNRLSAMADDRQALLDGRAAPSRRTSSHSNQSIPAARRSRSPGWRRDSHASARRETASGLLTACVTIPTGCLPSGSRTRPGTRLSPAAHGLCSISLPRTQEHRVSRAAIRH